MAVNGIGTDNAGLENLIAARKSLKKSLEKSRDLAIALEKTGPRLEGMSNRLPALEAAVCPMRTHKKVLFGIGSHIDRAVSPAAAVLRVFDAVHGLEKSLLCDPRSDIRGYLSLLDRLEEALKFLAENCSVATQWLEDIVEYLEENSVADECRMSSLRESLESLRALQTEEERTRLDGGLLEAALDKLEGEFRRLLVEHSVPLPMSVPGDQPCIAPPPLPVSVVQKLQLILERLTVNNRLERCLAIYVDVRGSNARASLQALDLEYLQAEFSDVRGIEKYIGLWRQHLEFAVKHLFDAEFKLCGEVYEKIGPDVWLGCFSKIALQAGMLSFLQFGDAVANSKKDPIKLLKLLDIFDGLNKLRPDFNKLFGGKPCFEIQIRTRDLVKKAVEGACELFWELLTQVELQRQKPPPLDGGVSMLVGFLVGYCNQLLEDPCRAILTQVLIIERSWRREKYQEKLLTDGIVNIIRALELNIETWSKAYEDPVLSHLFMMNNHWHFYVQAKGTKLGDILGDTWLREHQQYKEYYSAMYFRESWGKLPGLLSREGLIMFSGGRATARDLLKQRLKAFNAAFDDVYQKHARWTIPEKELREKTCHSAVQAIVPAYRSYMQSYGPLVEQHESPRKYVRYTAESLERMLGNLFEGKPGKLSNGSTKHYEGTNKNGTPDTGVANNGKTNHFRSSSTVI